MEINERIALDTNRLTDLFRGDRELAERLDWCDEVCVPLIVLGEIEAGFLGGDRLHRNRNILQTLFDKPTVEVLFPDRETASHYALLFVQLKKIGRPIPDNDLWIAALCVQHQLTLVTRDKHFLRIPQLICG